MSRQERDDEEEEEADDKKEGLPRHQLLSDDQRGSQVKVAFQMKRKRGELFACATPPLLFKRHLHHQQPTRAQEANDSPQLKTLAEQLIRCDQQKHDVVVEIERLESILRLHEKELKHLEQQRKVIEEGLHKAKLQASASAALARIEQSGIISPTATFHILMAPFALGPREAPISLAQGIELWLAIKAKLAVISSTLPPGNNNNNNNNRSSVDLTFISQVLEAYHPGDLVEDRKTKNFNFISVLGGGPWNTRTFTVFMLACAEEAGRDGIELDSLGPQCNALRVVSTQENPDWYWKNLLAASITFQSHWTRVHHTPDTPKLVNLSPVVQMTWEVVHELSRWIPGESTTETKQWDIWLSSFPYWRASPTAEWIALMEELLARRLLVSFDIESSVEQVVQIIQGREKPKEVFRPREHKVPDAAFFKDVSPRRHVTSAEIVSVFFSDE